VCGTPKEQKAISKINKEGLHAHQQGLNSERQKRRQAEEQFDRTDMMDPRRGCKGSKRVRRNHQKKHKTIKQLGCLAADTAPCRRSHTVVFVAELQFRFP
jgi:hypothetical protein